MAVLQSTLKLTLLDQVSARARAVTSALNGIQNTNKRMMAPLMGGMTQFLALAGAYVGVTEGIRGTIGAALSFEAAFADFKKVVDANDEQIQGFERSIRKLSTTIPATANDLAALYAEAAASGIATEELNKFAEMASRVGIAFDIPMAQAGESLAKLKTQLGLSLAETGDLTDVINHLGNTMASKESDITAFLLRVGALAKISGLAKEETAAIGSAMISAGAEPETAATALQNVVKAMTRGGSAKKSQKDAAKALGLNLPDLAKQMQKDAPGAIKKVLTAISKAPKDRHISLLSDFFGDEAKAFAPLVGNIKLLDDALASVADKTKYAGSAYKDYLARANTVGNVLQILQNKFAELGRSIGDDMLPGVKEAALGIGEIIDTLGQRAHIFDDLKYAIKGFTNGLGLEGGIKEAIKSIGDLLLGPADGSGSADRLGRIFAKFQGYGLQIKEFVADVKANIAQLEQALNLKPGTIVETLEKIGGMGFKLALAGVGIGILAGTVRTLAGAMYFLSGASTAVGILKTIASLGSTLTGTAATASLTSTATSTGTAFGTAFAAAAGAAMAAGLLLVLRELDPKGDLGGLTKPLDDFIEKHTGWNPAKDGLSFGDVLGGVEKLLPGKAGLDTLWNLFRDNGPIKPEISGARTPQQVLALDNARRGREAGFGGTTDTMPGKLADDYNIGVATNLKAILDRMSAIIPAKSANTYLDDTGSHPIKILDRMSAIIPAKSANTYLDDTGSHPIKIDAASISAIIPAKSANTYLDDTGSHPIKIDAASIQAMVTPRGTQSVRVENQQTPTVNVTNNITVTGVVDPKAAASNAASQIGEKVRSAVESANTD